MCSVSNRTGGYIKIDTIEGLKRVDTKKHHTSQKSKIGAIQFLYKSIVGKVTAEKLEFTGANCTTYAAGTTDSGFISGSHGGAKEASN